MRLTMLVTLLILVSSVGCKTVEKRKSGPPIVAAKPEVVCVNYQELELLRCTIIADETKFSLEYNEAPRFIAMTPEDFMAIVEMVDEIILKYDVNLVEE